MNLHRTPPNLLATIAAAVALTIAPAPSRGQTTGTPPLPATTPTESHATITQGVPNSDQSPGVVAQPQTGPGQTPSRPGIMTPGQTPAGQKDLLYYSADGMQYQAVTDETALVGNVDLRYNGYHVTCDRATFDASHHYLTFENNVVLTTERQVVLADYVRLNTTNNEFIARADGRSFRRI